MKRYTKPSILVLETETGSIMAASITIDEDGGKGSGSLIDGYATGEAMSKTDDNGVWDWGDEED